MTLGPRTAISPTASGPCSVPVTKSTAFRSSDTEPPAMVVLRRVRSGVGSNVASRINRWNIVGYAGVHRGLYDRAMRQAHALWLAHRARRVRERQVGLVASRRRLRALTPFPARHQILDPEDPVVVLQLLISHSDHVLQVRELGPDILEVLKEVDAVVLLGGEGG